MKNRVMVISVLLLGLSMGCKKNDDSAPMEIVLQKEPPLSFDLLDVPDDVTDILLTPTLRWESAKNPKGGDVTYDLYIDESLDPSTLIESGITGTSYQLTVRLQLLTDYHWKVVAKDAESNINKFSTRNLNFYEEPVVKEAEFSARTSHSSLVFNERLWIIGGVDSNFRNDVWYSLDGENWLEATSSAAFAVRRSHTTVVFDNKMWVIGGFTYGGTLNDVWSSTDGVNWTEMTTASSFPKRSSHSALVFDNKIWLIGGSADSGFANLKNDVWYSADGVHWNEATSAAPFVSRYHHATAVFEGKMWLVAGSSGGNSRENDVWNSDDGVNWLKAVGAAPFSNRSHHTLLVYDQKLWLIAGRDGTRKNDIWYSRDGIFWREAINKASFAPRSSHTTNVFNNKLWVLAGGVNPLPGRTNDVWAMD